MIEILVVDNNPGHVLLVKECLGDHYPVAITVVEDGEQALRLLATESFRPSLVLLELNLPKLHGHEALRRMRRVSPKLPIVVLSTSKSREDAGRAYAAGANMYAEKPADPTAFRRTIHTVARLWIAPLKGARAAYAG